MKQTYFNDWLEDIRSSRDDIQIESTWVEFAPTVPAVPEELYNYVISPNTQGDKPNQILANKAGILPAFSIFQVMDQEKGT